MDELLDERNLNVAGSINFSKEAVVLDGETNGWAKTYHEANFAQELHTVVEQIGGFVTGDEALYIK